MKNLLFKTVHLKGFIIPYSTFFLLLLACYTSYAQVGINTTNPNAILDIRSSNQVTPANNDGILIPKVDDFPGVNPTINQEGMLVFVTGNGTTPKGFYFWDNDIVSWVLITATIGTSNTLDQAYDQGGVGIGKNIEATDGAVRINGEDGFLVTGSFGAGNTIDTEIIGNGTRMFFNPNKAAFRAGRVFGNHWDDVNIGNYSTAFGYNATASGDYSIAFGFQTNATGDYATAFSNQTTASGIYSMAFGIGTTASEFSSTAFGQYTTASGATSTAFGYSTIASGLEATAFGLFTTASGDDATAFGISSIASGVSSTAFGNGSEASGDTSTAFGFSTIASGFLSTAFGWSTTASGSNTVAFGYQTIASGQTATAFGSQTTALGQHAMAFGSQTIASGFLPSTAFGFSTIASGDYSTAFGENTEASGHASTSFGQNTVASGQRSTVFGVSSLASGNISTAFGINNIASGTVSTAFSNGTEASGDYSTAFSFQTIASGDYSTAFGFQTIASGITTTTFGNQTVASGAVSTAFGNGSEATGDTSTAFGIATVASGLSSTAFGFGSTAPSFSETAIGSYNTPYTPIDPVFFNSQDRLFTIGNGTISSKSNALTIYKSGLMNINDAYDMPLTDGASNQVMATNGAGVVSFQNVSNLVSLNTLNQAYNQGGAGAGRIINADNGAVEIQNNGGLIVESTNQTHMLFVDGINDAVGINTAVPTANLSVNGTANKLGGGTWAVFSDSRLKKNVSNYNEGLELITSIRPVNFSYNAKMKVLLGENQSLDERIYQGVIAQELQKIAPDMVREVVVNKSNTKLESERFLEVDPNKFTYALINAVQEQQEMINIQQDKIETQSTKIVHLEKLFKKQQIEIEAIKTLLKSFEL